MAEDRARVSIIDQNSGKKYIIQMPTNLTVGQLMPYLVKQLILPTEGPGGAPIHYNLTLETPEGRSLLSEDDRLNEIGIAEDTVLRITPEMIAGTMEE